MFADQYRCGDHSPRMDAALHGLKSSLSRPAPGTSRYPFCLFRQRRLSAWYRDGAGALGATLGQPALFSQVIERLARDGCTLFLEIGPHALLNSAIRQTLIASGVNGLVLNSCRRGEDERGSLLNSLGSCTL